MSEQHHEIKVMIDGITEEFFPDAITHWNCEEVEDAGYDPDSGNSLTMSRTTSTEWEVDCGEVDCTEIFEMLKNHDSENVIVKIWFDIESESPNVISSPIPKDEVCIFITDLVEEVAQDNGFDGE
jgi:hypothetical protein